LHAALTRLEGDRALVTNGDSILDAALAGLVAQAAGRTAVVALAQVEDAGRYGRVTLGPQDRILGFAEKEPAGEPGLVNAGVYLVHRRRLESLPARRPLSLERDVFPLWIEDGEGLWGWRSGGRLLDIGVPESYASAAQFLSAHRLL
jgi:NDP-sugar pyrophosphorylase family protein